MTHNNSNSNSPRSPSSQPPPMNQQPPSLPQSIPTFLLGSHVINMPLHGQPFYSSPVWNGPVHQGTAQQQQDRPPSSGPSRSQRGGGRHRTGTQNRYQHSHASAGTIARDRSDSNNAGTGRASRPPSRYPSTANSYDRRSGASWTRKHTEDSAHQVPIMDSGRGASTGGLNPPVIPSLSPPAPPPSTPASAALTSTATSGVSDEDAEITVNTDIQRGSVEDDYYTISSDGQKTRITIRSRLGRIPNSVIEGGIFSLRFKFFNTINGHDLLRNLFPEIQVLQSHQWT
ncbi:hypothetical protein BYT27DRAFT_7203081 [Phlegmacium glaucopus]|nr:hypothetical protein BYT27DRAFT_7203081 [Phlegmacium glaucopus]